MLAARIAGSLGAGAYRTFSCPTEEVRVVPTFLDISPYAMQAFLSMLCPPEPTAQEPINPVNNDQAGVAVGDAL